MTKKFDAIDQALGIQVVDVPSDEVKENSKKIIKKSRSLAKSKDSAEEVYESDKIHTRNTIYELIQLGSDAAYDMLDIAKESQKARDFEVVGQLLKAVGDLSDKLLDNQQKIRKLESESESSVSNITNNTTNALFVGSTAELQNYLNEALKGK
jgi:hypothetical protein